MPTLLCDLDDTLFDHSGATRDALAAMRRHTNAFAVWPLDEFDRRHRVVLETLHLEVLAGRYTVEQARVERFRRLLADAGHDERRPDVLDGLSWAYRSAYERAWRMVDGAVPLVAAARARGWRVAIVTNNVTREQVLKVERGGLAPHIDALVTSEAFGASKPDPGILWHAIDRVGGTRARALVFGDSLTTDVAGAQAAGLPVVWFNRTGGTAPVPSVTGLTPADAVLEAFATALDGTAATAAR
jgi:HAD superfamily hydrolase (TIGR01509 family)